MKTEILESYQTYNDSFDFRTDFMIDKVLPVGIENYVILKKRLSPNQEVLEICGSVNKTIQISELLAPTTQINFTSIFPFKDGFGYIDQISSKIILWEELESEPIIINILKSENSNLVARKRCIVSASHDNSDNTLLIGINDYTGPADMARYWTIVKLPDLSNKRGIETTLQWESVQDLNPEFYPKTYYNDNYPTLEWLNINEIVKSDDIKYCYTTGGSRTRMRSGPEYEFSILSKIDAHNQLVQNLEVERGKRSFSSNKKFFFVRPKTKKRLVIYDLNEMSLTDELILNPAANLGKIQGNKLISADILRDKLYIYSLGNLNICRIIDSLLIVHDTVTSKLQRKNGR